MCDCSTESNVENDLVLTVQSLNDNPNGEFHLFLKPYPSIILTYSIVDSFAENYCSQDGLDAAVKSYSNDFKSEITALFLFCKVDASFLKLLDMLFPHVTYLQFKKLSEDCLSYLKSEDQTLSGRTKRLSIVQTDVTKDSNIIVSFKYLEELTITGSGDEVLKTLKKVDVLKKKCSKKLNSSEKSEMLPNLEVGFNLIFDSPLLQALHSVANLTVLSVSFKGQTVPSLIKFFKEFDIHKLKSINMSDTYFNQELLQRLTPLNFSKIKEFLITDWIRVDKTKHPISVIFPSSVTCLIVTTQLEHEDLQIIQLECKDLQFFVYYPRHQPGFFNFGKTAYFFQNCVLGLENLKVFKTTLLLDEQLLFSLWNFSKKIVAADFKVYPKNHDYFNFYYAKLFNKNLNLCSFDGEQMVHPVFPEKRKYKITYDYFRKLY